MYEWNELGICNHPVKECDECKLPDKLTCQFKMKNLIVYMIPIFFLIFLPAILGMVLMNQIFWIIIYIALETFFLLFFEIRVLCCHCSYYNKKKNMISCHIHYGIPKIWKYRPGPMSTMEKVVWLISFGIFLSFPIPILLLNQQYLLLSIVISGIIFWIVMEIMWSSKRCVNFSCPLNRVPKHIRDEYLKKDEIMRKAWEEKGYIIEERVLR